MDWPGTTRTRSRRVRYEWFFTGCSIQAYSNYLGAVACWGTHHRKLFVHDYLSVEADLLGKL